MTPVEVIALSGCSRPEGGRACSICIGAAEVHVKAVESAGLVVSAAVRDEELERLRLEAHVGATDRRMNFELRQEITRLRINAEKDVCSGCMQREEQRDRWMEATRQNGVKYEQAKERWYEAQDRAEDAERERDEWRERAEKDAATLARVRHLRDVYERNARTADDVKTRNWFELFVEELDAVLDPSSLPPETAAKEENQRP